MTKRLPPLLVACLLLAAPGVPAQDRKAPPRQETFSEGLHRKVVEPNLNVTHISPVKIDEARVAAAGIRKITSKRLTLYTDLPKNPAVDALPQAFDLAFPEWCRYFGVEPAGHDDWHITGFLMKDRFLFQQNGLIPPELPPFLHGYSWNYLLWLYDQPSDYYRRHLLIHEGTHSFMNTLLRGTGPPWYREGLAELLGTHQWQDGRLTLGAMPRSTDEVPQWGRVRIVKDGFTERKAMTLQRILDYPATAHLQTEPYGWCWAAAYFLDRHPRYRDRFHALLKYVTAPDLSAQFSRAIGDDWPLLAEEWQVFVAGIEYGYDVQRTAIDFTPGKPMAGSHASVTVAADRGWQNSGVELEAGKTYRLKASGRYQVASTPKVWWCEPGGVSIRYYQGRPLGMLLATVRPDGPLAKGVSALIRPTAIGLEGTLAPTQSGTLYLKINDSAGELDDNRGNLTVRVTAE